MGAVSILNENFKFGIYVVGLLLFVTALVSCSEKNDAIEPVGSLTEDGLFILNEGMFTFGNASLSFYNPANSEVQNQVFYRTNNAPLGDVAQSMAIEGENAWLVINNSGFIYQINRHTGEFMGKLSGFVSPRNMLLVDEHKAYVSDLYSSYLTVIDPNGYEFVGHIELGRSSEEMILLQNKVFVANWSKLNQSKANNMLMVVDVNSDQLIDSIQVGIEPNSMEIDKDGYLWVLCSGGYDGEAYPSLWKINPMDHEIEKSLVFTELQSNPKDLEMNASQDSLYYLNADLFKMSIYADAPPEVSFLESGTRNYYALAVDGKSGDIYMSDAVNYMTNGKIHRHASSGRELHSFEAGIIPGSFGFNRN